ncbi:MAG TPA: dihydrofolate reductase family protein [Iamia sp.]
MHLLGPARPVDDLLDLYDVERDVPADRPWVMANMVGGLDGTAAVGGRVGVLSDDTDAELFRAMRALADVVLVGAETARRERYGPVRLTDALTARRVEAGRPGPPPLAVVSRSLRLDWDLPLFASAGEHASGVGGVAAAVRPVVVTCAAADPVLVARAEAAVEPAVAVDALHERYGARLALCEGGPTLLGQVAAAGLLDELCLTIAPVLGGDPLPVSVTPAGAGLTPMALRHVAEAHGSLYLRYTRTEP